MESIFYSQRPLACCGIISQSILSYLYVIIKASFKAPK